MKKLFLLLSLLGCMLLFSVTAAAEEPLYTFTYEFVLYSGQPVKPYQITGFDIEPQTDEDFTLVLPKTYNDRNVTTIGSSAFYGYTNITDVVFPTNTSDPNRSAITEIENYAFGKTGLRTVYLPDNLLDEFGAFSHYLGYPTVIYANKYKASSMTNDEVRIVLLETLPYDYFNAERGTENGFCYALSEAGATILSTTNTGDVIVPDTIQGVPVIAIGENAFMGDTTLTSITLPDTITYIGQQAFAGCSSLTEFTIPSGVTELPERLFIDCTALEEVYLPNGLTAIRHSAFRNCAALTNLDFPDSLLTIGNYAFKDCVSLPDFDFPQSLTTIGTHAFDGCTSLTSITLPNSLVKQGYLAFTHCTNLEYFAYPESAERVQTMLGDCPNVKVIILPKDLRVLNVDFDSDFLKEIYVPATVNDIHNISMEKADILWVVEPGSYVQEYLDSRNITYKDATTGEVIVPTPAIDVEQGLFSFRVKNGKATLISVSTEATGVVEIPAEIDGYPVTTIGANAFENRSNVTEVYMPDTVTLIKGPVFNDCTNLGYIHLSENLKHIDGPLADGLPNIGAIYLPPSLESCYWEFLEEEYGLFGRYTDKLFIIGKPGSFAEGYAERLGFEFYSVDDGYWGTDNILLKKNETNTWSVVDCRSNRYTNCDHILQIIPEYCEGIPITKIESEAFDGCVSQEFYIGGNIQQIDARAFKNCRWLAAMLIMNPDCKLDSEFISGEEDSFYQLVLLGAKDSTAQKYAKEHNFFFEIYDGLPFDDINRNAFYYEPLLWAYYNGITSGISATKFAPDAPCTRAQVVTFLWRAAGCPEPETYDMPFTDISNRGFYYTALAWAYENNIVKGITQTTFSPNSNITRGQFMTFIWRTAACPEASGNNPFVDVTDGTFYYDAVLWGVENGITNGLGANNFGPTANCTRGQVVTFLYRGFAE